MQDRADRMTDRVERKTLDQCQALYSAALKRAVRRCAPTLEKLKELDSKKPPASCDTPEKADKWREEQRRAIVRKSGLPAIVAREIAKAGEESAEVIRASMDEIDRINRVVEDIGN